MRYPPGTDQLVRYLLSVPESYRLTQGAFEAWLEGLPVPTDFVRRLLVDLAEGGRRRWERDVVRGRDLISAADRLASEVEARTTRRSRDPLLRVAFKEAGSQAEYRAALLPALRVMMGKRTKGGEPDPAISAAWESEPTMRVFRPRIGRKRWPLARWLPVSKRVGLLPIHRMARSIAGLSDADLLAARELFNEERKSLELLQRVLGSFLDRWENRAGLFALTAVLFGHAPRLRRKKLLIEL
jgi:hypothetical protein